MADKRISQLIERTDIANNDVLPIVASGATTTNKVTISTIQEWMQDNLDVGVTSVGITIGSTGTDINVTGSPITTSGNITINIPTASATNRGLLSSTDWTSFNSKLSSVGLTMPSAFTVSNSPLTANGTIAVTGAGTVAQYIRGDGSLADFPEAGGGGASVSYYLNGSVSQGTIGGIAYREMNKTPILGAGTDFVAIADGYLASFITDAGDPALLEIPGGNWNFETYFSASSGGGTPSFYIELYKVSGSTSTLIASNSATPELIAFGTTITPYFSTLAVPQTTLALTDRLALRYYVARSGRTITLHTENSHLCQIITTFTTGLTALNGLTAQVQNFATGTSGTDFNISSTGSTHTFNLPDASASNRGAVTTGTQTFAGYKIFNGTIGVNNDLQLATVGTALNTFIKNINSTGLTSIGSNGFGFNNANNIYFSGSSKGGGVFAFSNSGTQTYTLQDASGTLAFTSDLGNYIQGVGTADSIPKFTGARTIANSAIRDTTSTVVISKNVSVDNGASQAINLTPASGGTTNRIETTGTLPLSLVTSGSSITLAAGGVTPQFTLTSGGNVGIGTTSPSVASGIGLVLNGQAGQTRLAFKNTFTGDSSGDGVQFALIGGSSGFVFQNRETDGYFSFETNGTERLNIASTGAATFSSSVTASTLNAIGSTDLLLNLTRSAVGTWGMNVTSGGNFFLNNRFGTNVFQIADLGAATFSSSVTAANHFSTGGSTFATSSGQVGIGTSSFAGDELLMVSMNGTSNTQAINVKDRNASATSSTYMVFRKSDDTFQGNIRRAGSDNALYVGGNEYISLGTGGNTERVRINSSGNVGIGTASPGQRLTVSGGYISQVDGGVSTFLGYDGTGSLVGTTTNHYLRFITNDTERMRITSAGNVGIGTASPSCLFQARGSDSLSANSRNLKAQIGGADTWGSNSFEELAIGFSGIRSTYTSGDNWDLSFAAGTSTTFAAGTQPERMRITSGGAVGIGKTLSITGVDIYQAAADVVNSRTGQGAGTATSLFTGWHSASPTTSGTLVFNVTSNGNVTNTNGSYGAISDIKLKENIQDATPKLDDLMKVKVRNYNLIGDDKKQIGVIAQELEEVFPAMIDESEDFEEVEVPQVDEEGNEILNEEGEVQTTKERVSKGTTTKSVKYSVFVPMLIKAMQEQQEQIKSLTEQVEALKSQING
jgi:hypothetical protein